MVEKLQDNVYWVGYTDWQLRHFHGHELSLHHGTTYNSYLVRDRKTALIDLVWNPFRDHLLGNLHQVIEPKQIDYVVVNHAEPDHSGALPELMRHAPDATIVCSERGRESLLGHYHTDWNMKTVKTGERISLGNRDLIFVEAPMLHWPDSMFTYLTDDNILFPNDAFGQHYATAFRFNDQVNQQLLYREALKYYANILTPFSKLVLRKIDELLGLELPVDMIAPSHGVVWRRDPLQIVEKYREWAQQKPLRQAVILYDTMWDATRRMAEAIGQGLASHGVGYILHHMSQADRNDALTDVFESKAVLVGSPTLNRGVLPTITPILEDLHGLRFQHKIGAAFGSYGWSGECVATIEDHLARSNIDRIGEGLLAKWQPRKEDLERCIRLGEKVAEVMKQERFIREPEYAAGEQSA